MSDPRPTAPGQRDKTSPGLTGLSDAFIGMIVAILAALPTLVAALMKPELLLDDIEFAARARFEGWGGFVYEMGYRPGQGLIHALQFNLLGNHPALHLVVLAAGNALAAWLFWRLLSLTVPRGIALATITTFVVLPNRGSLRFWTSTLPNHIAMCLLLTAAIVAATRVKQASVDSAKSATTSGHPLTVWFVVTLLSLLSIVTYEATITLAPFITIALAATSPSRRDRFVLPAGVFALYGLAAVVLKARSPRSDASTLFARPLEAIPKHLEALSPRSIGILGSVVVVVCVVWAVTQTFREGHRASLEPRLACFGTIVGLAGLAPFAAAGFNIQSQGVLDRAHYFPTLGTALLIGTGLYALHQARASVAVRALIGTALMLSVVGQIEDLEGYSRSGNDQREAAAALLELHPTAGGDGVRIANPPAGGGVSWGFYGPQVRDLYRLVHDDPVDPTWLAFGSRPTNEAAPTTLAYFEIEEGQLVVVNPTDN